MVTTLSPVRLQHGEQVHRRLKLEEHIQRKTSPSAKFNSQLEGLFPELHRKWTLIVPLMSFTQKAFLYQKAP